MVAAAGAEIGRVGLDELLDLPYSEVRALALGGDKAAAEAAFFRAWEQVNSGQIPESPLSPRQELVLMYFAWRGPLAIDGAIVATAQSVELLAAELVYSGTIFSTIYEATAVRNDLIGLGQLRKFEGVIGALPVILVAIPSESPAPFVVDYAPLQAPPAAEVVHSPPADPVKVSGKIVHVKTSGGFWGLVSKAGKRYDIDDSIPDEFKKEGLAVIASLFPIEAVGMRMWGELAKIDSIDADVTTDNGGGGMGAALGAGLAALALVFGVRYLMKKR